MLLLWYFWSKKVRWKTFLFYFFFREKWDLCMRNINTCDDDQRGKFFAIDADETYETWNWNCREERSSWENRLRNVKWNFCNCNHEIEWIKVIRVNCEFRHSIKAGICMWNGFIHSLTRTTLKHEKFNLLFHTYMSVNRGEREMKVVGRIVTTTYLDMFT